MSKQTRSMQIVQAFLPLILGAILAVFILRFFAAGSKVDPEQLAMGAGTSSHFTKYEGRAIHCKDMRDAARCIDDWAGHGKAPVALWLGNSQLHAINQYEAGQQTASCFLFERLKKTSVDLITYSQPNATLVEHYVLFSYLSSRLPVRFLLMPVVFDDLRENEVRQTIRTALKDDATRQVLRGSEAGKKVLEKWLRTEDVDRPAEPEKASLLDKSEEILSARLGRILPMWNKRGKLRVNVYIALYHLRNWAFGISPETKRRTIPLNYEVNMSALEALLDLAKRSNTKVLLYIPPVRNDGEFPWVIEDYELFKTRIAQLADGRNVIASNLEGIVPAQYWGLKQGNNKLELDFFHFQQEGHKLLAQALGDLFETELAVKTK